MNKETVFAGCCGDGFSFDGRQLRLQNHRAALADGPVVETKGMRSFTVVIVCLQRW